MDASGVDASASDTDDTEESDRKRERDLESFCNEVVSRLAGDALRRTSDGGEGEEARLVDDLTYRVKGQLRHLEEKHPDFQVGDLSI